MYDHSISEITGNTILNINDSENYSFITSTQSNENIWFLNGEKVSTEQVFSNTFLDEGTYYLCLLSTSNNCSDQSCIEIRVIGTSTSCPTDFCSDCEILRNGDLSFFDPNLDNNFPDFIVPNFVNLYSYQSDPEYNPICDWYNSSGSAIFCFDPDNTKIALRGDGLQNSQIFGSANELGLIDGETYEISLNYNTVLSSYNDANFDNVNLVLGQINYSNFNTVQSESVLSINDMTPELNVEIWESPFFPNYQNLCDVEPTKFTSTTFTYDQATMGQYLFIHPVTNIDTDAYFIVDNISIQTIECLCNGFNGQVIGPQTGDIDELLGFEFISDSEIDQFTWQLDGNIISNQNSVTIQIQEVGSHELCITIENQDCCEIYCNEFTIVGDSPSCEDLDFMDCNIVLNGDLDQNLELEGTGQHDHTFLFGAEMEFDNVCNWVNRIGRVAYCLETNNQSPRFLLRGVYQNSNIFWTESVSTTNELGLEHNVEYELSFDFSINLDDQPGSGTFEEIQIGLSQVIHETDDTELIYPLPSIGNNVTSSIVAPGSSYDDWCAMDLNEQYTTTFTYNENLMGQFLFFETILELGSTRANFSFDNVIIRPTNQPIIQFPNIPNHCLGEESASATATGGDGDYTYDWTMVYDVITLDNEELWIDIGSISDQNLFQIDESVLPQSVLTQLETNNLKVQLTVTVTDENGCSAVQSDNFTIWSLPIANVTFENSDCDNDGQICIHISAHDTRTGIKFSLDGGNMYEDLVSDNSGSICYDRPEGTYDVWARWGANNSPCPVQINPEVIIGNDCVLDLVCTDDPNIIAIGDPETIESENISTIMADLNLTSPIVDQEFYVNGSLIVNIGVDFDNCNFYFEDGSDLTITNHLFGVEFKDCVLTACTDTWEGVDASNGSVRFLGSEVSHAFKGIQILDLNQPGYAGGDVIIDDCVFNGNYEAVSIETFDKWFTFDNCEVYGPNYSIGAEPDDWTTGPYYLPKGLNIIGGGLANQIGLNGPNLFTDIGGNDSTKRGLFYGIYADNSTIEVENCVFTDIGSNDFHHGVVTPSGTIPSTAIRCNSSPYTSTVTNCEVINCSRGFWMQTDLVEVSNNNPIDVHDMGIAGGKYLVANNNTIISDRIGIRALNGSTQEITYNDITINDGSVFQNTAGIHLAKGYGANNSVTGLTIKVENNNIITNDSRGGILAQNMVWTSISENTIKLYYPNETSGIISEGGAEQEIFCNDISSTYGSQTGVSNGYSGEISGKHELFNNLVYDLTNGIYIRQQASLNRIGCTIFDGGNIGLRTESILGPQLHGVNRWADGQYNVDAQSSFSDLLNASFMQFEVAEDFCDDDNMDGYFLFPCNIIPVPQDDGWFDFDDDGPQTCEGSNCDGEVGSDGYTSPEDELNTLCEWNEEKSDTLTCEEQWVQDYQLYSMIRNEGIDSLDRLEDYDCLATFLDEIDGSPISTFYTIDSLLSVQDSMLTDSLLIADELLSNAVEAGDRTGTIESLQSEINLLLSQLDSFQQHNLTHADSLLTEIDKDSCDIITDWQLVYSILIDESNAEEISQSQIDDLEVIALKCPIRVGHVIYSARRIVSDRTYLRYDLIDDCGRAETRSRQDIRIPSVNQLNVAPNPASDQVTLHLPNGEGGKVTIVTLNGLEVYSAHISKTNQHLIQTSSLQSGVYLVSYVSSNGEVSTAKLVLVD